MNWCDACKYNPPNYLSHEPDKPCGDCWVYGEGNKPTKFVETDNRQTNADRIRSMTDEKLAEMLSRSGKYFCHGNGYDPHSERCDYGDECEECWRVWLRQEAAE